MTGPDVSVVPEDVREAGQLAQRLAQELRSALESAGRDVDSLTSGGWSGTASDAFGAGWQEFHRGGIDVLTALAGMAERLGANADNYQTQDARNAAVTYRLNIQY